MAVPKLVYHYTNIESLISGILTRNEQTINDNEICLWATHCEYLNDPIDTYLGDILLHNNQEIKDILKVDLKYLIDKIKSSYIISFSESKDCLPMWNMYGKNGKGIKLGFDFEKLICNPKYVDNFHSCVYENTEKYERYCDMIIKKVRKTHEEGLPADIKDREINIDAFIHGLIHGYAKQIKSHSYEYEKEWRIIIPAYKNEAPIEFRYSSGILIPYIKQCIPKEVLKEIWIGPTNDITRTEKSIRLYLDSIGFSDVEIKKSKIPFRN